VARVISRAEAGIQFVLVDAQQSPFLNRISYPDDPLPHFEVFLESPNMCASAVRSQGLAWRTEASLIR
jgi:hypothetical protein